MKLRAARPSDIPALLDITVEGLDGYREFAPEGWSMAGLHDLEPRVIDDDAWWWLAEDPEPVGHALMIPAARSREPVEDPALGHVMQLFVRRAHWGRGVATSLHEAMVEQAPPRGYAELPLFTPLEHGRARRFYEREGWRALREWHDSPLGLPVVEYRRRCPTPS